MTNDYSWAAGYLCGQGTFTISSGKPLLVVKTLRDRDSIRRLARVMGAQANVATMNGKEGMRMTLSGEPLHSAMKNIWSELSTHRKHEYAAIRKATNVQAD